MPEEYYDLLRESDPEKREILKERLYKGYPLAARRAKKEAFHATLGEVSDDLVDRKIENALKGNNNWVLIGGPPCQAYSLVGRSRVGGINEEDHRVYLYKEYLRIIAIHHPAVFVMENVKGLLSAKVNGEKVFDWMLRDLREPGKVIDTKNSPNYRIYSLTTPVLDYDIFGNPIYAKDTDYLIQSEKYGIPQKRHRVILLGIRQDINHIPDILKENDHEISLREVIDDLPRIRSMINRSILGSEIVRGKKRNIYKSEEDSDHKWKNLIQGFFNEISRWNGFSLVQTNNNIEVPYYGGGAEFIHNPVSSTNNPLSWWYYDARLKGVCNHQSRSHLTQDLMRYAFSALYTQRTGRFPRLNEFYQHSLELLPEHANVDSGKFVDRFRVQLPDEPATTVTSHISKDGHYFIHYDPNQCRSLSVREAARVQTFPDNYLFCGTRTAQYHQVGNAVPPFLASQIAKIVRKLLSE